MALTREAISRTESDEELRKLLLEELSDCVDASLHDDLDDFVASLESVSPGMRAMAATYQLDVSMSLDDLGWHFGKWHHLEYCRETAAGLRELETGELAEIFERAYSIAGQQWEEIGSRIGEGFDAFANWYQTSELEATLMPLNRRWWELCPGETNGLFAYWVAYARKYPERVVD